jgi:diamine N-acetyltransferase
MNDTIIRLVTLNDIDTLVALAKKTFYDAFVGTCTPYDMQDFLDEYYNNEVLTEELNNPNYNFYFALHNAEIVGYSKIAINCEPLENKKAIELKRLYVLESYHGKGIAQHLMNHFVDYAKANKYEIAYLGVWEYNYKAQNFYKKYGFTLTNLKHDFPVGTTPQTDVYMVNVLG